jgi:hypothetical protein
MFSVWLAEAREDTISELTAYYKKADAHLVSAIERGEIEKARNLLKLKNNVAKELAQKKSLANCGRLHFPIVASPICAAYWVFVGSGRIVS